VRRRFAGTKINPSFRRFEDRRFVEIFFVVVGAAAAVEALLLVVRRYWLFVCEAQGAAILFICLRSAGDGILRSADVVILKSKGVSHRVIQRSGFDRHFGQVVVSSENPNSIFCRYFADILPIFCRYFAANLALNKSPSI
jgi:hypothetical protein